MVRTCEVLGLAQLRAERPKPLPDFPKYLTAVADHGLAAVGAGDGDPSPLSLELQSAALPAELREP
jgi:hypothetical protein